MVLTSRFQRLGDLAAGTMVVVEEPRYGSKVPEGRGRRRSRRSCRCCRSGCRPARRWRGRCRITSGTGCGSAATAARRSPATWPRPLRERYALPEQAVVRRRPLRRSTTASSWESDRCGWSTGWPIARRTGGSCSSGSPGWTASRLRKLPPADDPPARRALPIGLRRPDAGRGPRPPSRHRGVPPRPGRPGPQRGLPGQGVPPGRLGGGRSSTRSPAGSGPTRCSGWRP